MQWHRSPTQRWFLALVRRAMEQEVSTRSGSKLSGEGPGNAQLDLNRQMKGTNDPQGMYIVGADGTPYGFTNDHDPVDILRFLDLGLQRFQQRPPRPVTIADAEKTAPFSIVPAATTQVVAVFARIPQPPAGCSELNRGVGRDWCWIYPEDARTLARGRFPAALARRIARFHLVDDVRGTPDLWTADALRRLTIASRATGPGQMRFTLDFALRDRSQGYEGRMEGEVHVEPSGQIRRFRALADGRAWGAGTYTPNPPPGRYLLRIALTDTRDPAARIVPPEEVATANNDRQYRRP